MYNKKINRDEDESFTMLVYESLADVSFHCSKEYLLVSKVYKINFLKLTKIK